MNLTVEGAPFPPSVPAPMAWDAFKDLFQATDWHLRIKEVAPIAVRVEHDDRFGRCLSEAERWKAFDQAKGWIANRILQLAQAIGKTYVRRLSLQIPPTPDGPIADALLANLKGRIEDSIRHELVAHFDTSVDQWERDALDLVSRMEDRTDRWLMTRYLGLDQRVSVDAARKAIRFVFFRPCWHLAENDGRAVLVPDHQFKYLRSLRSSLDEQTRARSLVARCIERLFSEHDQACRTSLEVAPMTRARLKAEIDRRFAEEGVWGLIHLALPWDRDRNFLFPPVNLDEHLRDLIDRQARWCV